MFPEACSQVSVREPSPREWRKKLCNVGVIIEASVESSRKLQEVVYRETHEGVN